MAAQTPANDTGTHLSVDDLLQRNKEYAVTTHKSLPPLIKLFGGSFSNGPHIIVGKSRHPNHLRRAFSSHLLYSHIPVACLDSRCNPYQVFSLTQSEAIVIRNPGGRIWSAFPDIVALDARFSIDKIVLLQHSDCGTSYLTEALVRERIATAAAPESAESLRIRKDVIEYKISHGEQGVREDLALVRSKNFLRKELVEGAVGFWLDTSSGLVNTVD